MRIKKFTCINCGAPKVNTYTSPYIVCDYCGSFTDIDFSMGMDFWNQSPLKTAGYAFNKMQYMSSLQYAMQKGDKVEYSRLQRSYWDYYYRTYPAYLPPSIDTAEEYKLYLDVCADSSTSSAFDDLSNAKQLRMKYLQNQVTYGYVNGSQKAATDPFFTMANYFIDITKQGFKDFYENPKYEIMNELLPQSVHLKMKVSMFVQAWLPYLTDEDSKKLLKLTGFSLDYVEIAPPKGHEGKCEHCQAALFIPEGSYKVFCEKCRKKTRVFSTYKCTSCGADNNVPDNPGKPIVCQYCGTENRIIRPMFG
jgi:DNA-directed RNA polymerase subunit RPC12/RpoP